MPNVALPNGQVAEFPDTMSQDQISAVLKKQFPSAQQPSESVAGLSGSITRGLAPYAAGAVAGAALGAPFAGVGAVPGAVAGIGATALTEFGGSVYNWLARYAGLPEMTTPQDLSDKALDAIGVSRPRTTTERAAESAASFVGSMAGAPATPTPKSMGAPQKSLQDFERQGVTPSVPAVGQGGAAGLAANIGTRLPVTGPVIRGSVTRQISETADAAARRAADYGTPQDQFGAGAIVKNALNRYGADKSQAHTDYGAFTKSMSGAPPVPMASTMKAVNDLMGRFPSAPGLTGLFTKSPIARLQGELEPRTEIKPAIVSKIAGPEGEPVVLRPEQKVERGGTLTMPELMELRSQVGYQLERPNFGPDQIPRAQLKRLYAALTSDMKAAAQKQGPEAVKALTKATTNYAVRMQVIDRLEPLVSGDSVEATARRLTAAASSTGSADAGLLRAAKSVMTPEEWGDFGASIVSRLGEPSAGAADILAGANFSPSSFMTNWNKLSPRAKDMLFGSDDPGTPRASLEELARVAQAQKSVAKLANVSHSGEYGIGAFLAWEAAKAAWAAITEGNVRPLLGWGAASGAGYGFAKLLTSPQFARWLYRAPKPAVVTPQLVARGAVSLLNALSAPSKTERTNPHGGPLGDAAPGYGLSSYGMNTPLDRAAGVIP